MRVVRWCDDGHETQLRLEPTLLLIFGHILSVRHTVRLKNRIGIVLEEVSN